MIITISGTAGSGKSTIAKLLAEKLGAERIYVGGIRRELAKKKGMTLAELNEYAKTHPETDVDIDQQAAAQARTLEKSGRIVVVEGRPQYHFLPESIKIFIKVDLEEAARRIWKDLQKKEERDQRNEGNINSLEEMKEELERRQENDFFRYKKYYRLNFLDESQYDLVLDTTNLTIKEAAGKVIQFVEERKTQ